MGHQQSMRSSEAVRSLGWSEPWFATLSQSDSELDQGASDGVSRGKSFGGNLGYRTAVFDVFFFEESFGSPAFCMGKFNGINKIGVFLLGEESGSSESRLARQLYKIIKQSKINRLG